MLEEQSYKALKSSSQREKLFEEFIMNAVLVTPGQKRQRLIEKGATEDNETLLKLDKSERKRLKKEQNEALEKFKKILTEKVTEVNVSISATSKFSILLDAISLSLKAIL